VTNHLGNSKLSGIKVRTCRPHIYLQNGLFPKRLATIVMFSQSVVEVAWFASMLCSVCWESIWLVK